MRFAHFRRRNRLPGSVLDNEPVATEILGKNQPGSRRVNQPPGGQKTQ